VRTYHATRATGLFDEELDLLPALWLAPEGWGLSAEEILQLPEIFDGRACFVWSASEGTTGSERFRQLVRVFGKRPALRRAVVLESDVTIGGRPHFFDVAKVETREAAAELAEGSADYGSWGGLVMSRSEVPVMPPSLLDLFELKERAVEGEDRSRQRRDLRNEYLASAEAQGDIPILVLDDCDMRPYYVAPVTAADVDLGGVKMATDEDYQAWLRRGMRIRLSAT
jgi:hypothetical protein